MLLSCFSDHHQILDHICSYIVSSRTDYPSSFSTTSLLLPLKFTCKSLFANSNLCSHYNPLFKSLFEFSVFFGNLDLLTWSLSFIGQFEKNHIWIEDACPLAALNGHLEVLKYLHQNRYPWDERACSNAAQNRHLEVLKYLHQNICPWNEEVLKL